MNVHCSIEVTAIKSLSKCDLNWRQLQGSLLPHASSLPQFSQCRSEAAAVLQCPAPNTCEHQTETPAPFLAWQKPFMWKMLPGNVTAGAQVTFLSPSQPSPLWNMGRSHVCGIQHSKGTGLYFLFPRTSQITTRHHGLAEQKATGMTLSRNYSHTS